MIDGVGGAAALSTGGALVAFAEAGATADAGFGGGAGGLLGGGGGGGVEEPKPKNFFIVVNFYSPLLRVGNSADAVTIYRVRK